MKIISGPRDSGKAKEIFELAKETNSVIITPNSRGLRVKANSYGFSDLTIIEPEEIMGYAGENFILHNVDKIILNYFLRRYSSEVLGMSATITE